MTISKFCLVINGHSIDQSSLSCTGYQLSKLMRILELKKSKIYWYACDIEVVDNVNYWLEFDGWRPRLLGNYLNKKKAIENTSQFLSGVFLGVLGNHDFVWRDEYSTEDPPFGEIEAALLQIRAFDTTNFEIYSANQSILNEIRIAYGGKIKHCTI